MNKKLNSILILFIGVIFINGACKKLPIPVQDLKVYSYLEEITNPPDSFMIIFSLTQHNYFDNAIVTFDSSAVWSIEQVNSFSASVWSQREGDTNSIYFESLDSTVLSIGFEGGVNYEFLANNNNYPESRKLYLRFDKTDIDYESYSPKL